MVEVRNVSEIQEINDSIMERMQEIQDFLEANPDLRGKPGLFPLLARYGPKELYGTLRPLKPECKDE